MPNILAVHALDAITVLDTFRLKLDAGPIRFFNVQDPLAADQLRRRLLEESREANICLIFSSDLLGRLLRPLLISGSSPDQFSLSTPHTITYQLNLTERADNVRHEWRDLFHATQLWRGDPLLSMTQEKLDEYVLDFGSFLRSLSRSLIRSIDYQLQPADLPVEIEIRPRPSGVNVSGKIRVSGDLVGLGGDIIGSDKVVLIHDDPRVVELLFATNRAPVCPPGDPLISDFSGERAEALSFGTCRVRVPEVIRLATWNYRKRPAGYDCGLRMKVSMKDVTSLSR